MLRSVEKALVLALHSVGMLRSVEKALVLALHSVGMHPIQTKIISDTFLYKQKYELRNRKLGRLPMECGYNV
jgi:hypothetical protein